MNLRNAEAVSNRVCEARHTLGDPDARVGFEGETLLSAVLFDAERTIDSLIERVRDLEAEVAK